MTDDLGALTEIVSSKTFGAAVTVSVFCLLSGCTAAILPDYPSTAHQQSGHHLASGGVGDRVL